MRVTRWIVTAAALLALPPGAAAQGGGVDTLARVRIVLERGDPRIVVGRLLSADTARLVVDTRRGSVAVPVDGVRRVDVSRGRRIGVLRGTAQGFVGGVVLVGALYIGGRAIGSDCDDCLIGLDAAAVSAAPALIAFSTGVGFVSGFLPGRERWRRQPLPVRVLPIPLAPPVGDSSGNSAEGAGASS